MTLLSLLFVVFLTMSACSLEVKENTEKKYKEENPLVADIILPETSTTEKDTLFQVSLTQGETKIDSPEYVHFEIWKYDHSVTYERVEGNSVGNGLFELNKKLDEEGLYFVKVHARYEDSIIMPKKQFIVGELSKAEVEFLQEGTGEEESGGEHHH
ncbi:FixH family protein [Bacillus weihaiensis]|uniref:FixH family protein n=1 Tax=Bacillus weihaiensis TaxID=1547283 RepID=UPI00235575D1|nr:FixH family protein [Bacillus weihaiensis]